MMSQKSQSETHTQHRGHVFIAHAGEEKPVALKLAAELEAREQKCWIAPRDVPAGRSYSDGIIAGIRDASCLLLVYTESVNASPHIESEIERAFSQGKPIIVVRYCDSPFSDSLSYFLDKTQWINAIGPARATATTQVFRVVDELARTNPKQPDLEQSDARKKQVTGRNDDRADISTNVDAAKPLKVIGAFRIERTLGVGGMGEVYLATRIDNNVKMQVAIKVVKKGMDTREVLARFRSEKQLLASLSHPNIARLLDAGETDDGRPYFVMEYVQGESIDKYCDAKQLGTKDRLKLFLKVCSAVDAAHKNLIVHRDIKPSNVIVGPDGEPKLLDFGIAKMLNSQLAAITVVTGPELHVMTPEYASPEQARGDALTTATDVYSLGVLLYELLTGKRPYSFKTRVRDEVLRIVQDAQPVKAPSTAIASAEEIVGDAGATKTVTAEELARLRDASIQKLRKSLQGDIDNIVLKALQKPVPRRYQSIGEFASDINNYLIGAPVAARGDSFAYVCSRLIARHKGKVAATSAAALLVLLAGGALLWQQGKVRERESKLSAVRGIAAKTVDELVDGMNRTEGGLESRRVLAKASGTFLDALQSTFADDPVLSLQRARALRAIGDVQGGRGQNLGQTQEAIRSYTEALSLVTSTTDKLSRASGGTALGPMSALDRSILQAELRIALGSAQRDAGDKLAAKATSDAALAGLKHSDSAINNARPVQHLRAQALLLLSEIAGDAPNPDPALATELRNASLVTRRELAQDPKDLEAARNLSVMLVRLGENAEYAEPPRFEAALQHYREALAMRERVANIAPDATSRRDVAMAKKFIADVLLQVENDADITPRVQEAERLIVDAQTIVQALSEATPTDERLRRDSAELLRSAAWLASAKGDGATQQARLADAAKKLEALARANDANVLLRGSAVDAYRELAAVQWAAGDKSAARTTLGVAREIAASSSAGKMEDYIEAIDASLTAWN